MTEQLTETPYCMIYGNFPTDTRGCLLYSKSLKHDMQKNVNNRWYGYTPNFSRKILESGDFIINGISILETMVPAMTGSFKIHFHFNRDNDISYGIYCSHEIDYMLFKLRFG